MLILPKVAENRRKKDSHLDLARWGRISRPSEATNPSASFQLSLKVDGLQTWKWWLEI